MQRYLSLIPFPVRWPRVVIALTLVLWIAPLLRAAPIEQAFRLRMEAIDDQLATLVAAAEASATRLLAHPEALLNVPWNSQKTFCEEKINRAGGLAHAFPTEARSRARRQTDHDVVLLSVRSWAEAGDAVIAEINGYRERGWLLTLIASRAGKPADLQVDFFIDNGAPNGDAGEGALNAIVNSTLGWMWVCEYAGAMTRQGRIPAILRSVAYDDARAPNREVQTPDGRHTTFAVDTAVDAGVPARLYRERIMSLIADIESEPRREQIRTAARLIRERLAGGRSVWLSGVGHMIEHEMHLDMQSEWKPLTSRTNLERNLQATAAGDLVVWIGYIGMNSRYRDYEALLDRHELDLITCYLSTPANWKDFTDDPNVLRDAASSMAHIDQTWEMGDAVVPVPGPAGSMGPISGINAMLLCRMLDAEILRQRQAAPGETVEPSDVTAD